MVAKLTGTISYRGTGFVVVDVADIGYKVNLPDDAIAGVCASIRWRPGQIAAHTSGACSLRELEAARRQGALINVNITQ